MSHSTIVNSIERLLVFLYTKERSAVRFRAIAVLASLVLALCPSRRSAAADDSAFDSGPQRARPNILFIFADDLAFDAVGFHGNHVVQTPTLDGLARRGAVFTHAYNMGAWSGAVCVASRTMLNTGKFVWAAKKAVPDLKTDWSSQRRLWPQRMHDGGYRTYMTGKWHVAVGADSLFDHVRHIRPGMPKQVEAGYDRPKSPDDRQWLPWDTRNGGYWEGGRHWSEVVADDTIEFLKMAESDERPFFMYVAFNAPHDPRQSPKEYVEHYPADSIPLPEPFFEEHPFDIGSNRIRDERLAPFPRTPYSVQVNRGEYYALIEHLDAQIARIMEALEASGQVDNTLIVFTADHGLACGHHGLMGKQNQYDPSVRVPFVIAGPGVESGRRLPTPIYLQDVMPTTLELAGQSTDDVDFRSLWPVLTGAHTEHYQAIYGSYLEAQRMVTDGRYKLIAYPKINRLQFFDLANDPWEQHDLIDSVDARDRVAAMQRELIRLQGEIGDELELPSMPLPDEDGR